MTDNIRNSRVEQISGQSRWMIDPKRSAIRFSVRHMMVDTVEGRFTSFRGELLYDHHQGQPTGVVVEIDANSLDTGQVQRDIHVRSGDFLDVENFPHIRFASRDVEPLGNSDYRVNGDLRLRRETRPVELEVEFNGFTRASDGQLWASFRASTRISRRDFGSTWNQPVETGGVLVGDVITIELNILAKLQG